MTKLLYINASPRGAEAASTQAAQVFLEHLPEGVTVNELNLFAMDLPEVGADVAAAKQKFMFQAELDETEQSAWDNVLAAVENFKDADHYLMAIPMWNFSIPYKMKQYIDLITHPGLMFSMGPDGRKGHASGSLTLIYTRGGDYSPKDGVPDPFDFQSTYMKGWATLIGLSPVQEVLVQNTVMKGVDGAVAEASEQLAALARGL